MCVTHQNQGRRIQCMVQWLVRLESLKATNRQNVNKLSIQVFSVQICLNVPFFLHVVVGGRVVVVIVVVVVVVDKVVVVCLSFFFPLLSVLDFLVAFGLFGSFCFFLSFFFFLSSFCALLTLPTLTKKMRKTQSKSN